MDARDFLKEYLYLKGKKELFSEFEDFFKLWSKWEFDHKLLTEILANVDFKHSFAKFIVNQIVQQPNLYYYPVQHNHGDLRLQCFISYYLAVEILNGSMSFENAKKQASYTIGDSRVDRGSYIKGLTLSSTSPWFPVTMGPGMGLHPGYRAFIINMLCFMGRKFIMGMRCDSGPIHSMKYHKGCRPLGMRKASNGLDWTVFEVNRDLSDDYTAVLSNGLEGDGTVEVCDWISDSEQRVVFRENF